MLASSSAGAYIGTKWVCSHSFFRVSGPLCLSSSSALLFRLFFSCPPHHPVNWDDRHLLAHAINLWLYSHLEVFSKWTIGFQLWIKHCALIRQGVSPPSSPSLSFKKLKSPRCKQGLKDVCVLRDKNVFFRAFSISRILASFEKNANFRSFKFWVTLKRIWDRCYAFENIFAKILGETIDVFLFKSMLLKINIIF
jgi:hypothetical protein